MLNKTKQGFTLIELLVVIAIIAILASILFPVFGRARENARRSSCQSNLKQIGLGLLQYVQDYDERYPLSVQAPGGTVDLSTGWVIAMQPYMKSTQIFQCPSETNPANNVTPGVAGYGGVGFNDYWYNRNISGKSQASMDFAASTVMNGDGTSGTSGYTFDGFESRFDNAANTAAFTAITGSTTAVPSVAPAAPTGGFGLRHLDGINYAFADGHVKWLKSESATSMGKVANSQAPYAVTGSAPTFYAG